MALYLRAAWVHHTARGQQFSMLASRLNTHAVYVELSAEKGGGIGLMRYR